MKFGDRVVGIYASIDNPQRKGIFVKYGFRSGKLNHGKYAQITDGKGNFWECPIENLIQELEELMTYVTDDNGALLNKCDKEITSFREQLAEAQTKIEALEAEAAELRKDKSRIDSIERHKKTVSWKRKSWRYMHGNLELLGIAPQSGPPFGTYATVREAIDEAEKREGVV